MEQDLHNLKDDMVAFIEGHGLKRFHGPIKDEIPSVPWAPDEEHPDAWKDFVELAKASGVSFVTMSYTSLDSEDVDFLIERLEDLSYMTEEDMEEARWLKNFVGKVGHVQIGFPCQGVMFVYEVSTDWYENFERLESAADEFDGILIDDADQEED
ncbi:MAG TPA: hypothetical protein VKD65_08425 [Candidatus Angelobacter sp.]|nr:hypothetical protein [Candidatus Angelobacter sp.]HKE31735.1 hypothetical protein [Candidatus Angelobacter sp.]